jgi:hypothetical protein
MTTPRYVVVASDEYGRVRVFGPMNAAKSATFRDGLAARHPGLRFVVRAAQHPTYRWAADVLKDIG